MRAPRLLSVSLILLLAAGCSPADDTDADCAEGVDCTDEDTGDDAGVPVAEVSDTSLDLGRFCERAEGSFTISNTGDATLSLGQPEVTGDWSVVDAPTEVAPGETATVEVASGPDGGNGSVSWSLDDLEMRSITVSLTAEPDQPPEIVLDTPDEILAPDAVETLTGTATDDGDPSELTVTWSSDQDGALSGEAPDGSGRVELPWDASVRSSGDHTVTATVTDACGAVAEDSVTLCQNEGYVEDSLDLASWTFGGSASWDATNEWVELTPDSRYVVGSAFATSQTVPSDQVSIAFRFFAGTKDGSGADGFSLTAIDTTRATTYDGAVGGGLGYGDLPGWTLEVDTWDNTGDPGYSEPTRNEHIAIVIDGASKGNGVAWAEIPNVEDGAWHDMKVEVFGKQVRVTLDGSVVLDQAVPEITTFPAHIGFTAATGAATNSHRIDALSVEGFVCE